MKKIIILALGLLIAYSGYAQQYKALKFKATNTLFSYEMMKVHEQYANRRKNFQSALQGKTTMEHYVRNLRKRFIAMVGDLPEKNQIESKVVGIVKGNGFAVEKIIFMSAPGRYVTAHLYRPKNTSGRIPACIEMCGHGINGKGSGSILAERMAVNGIAVMVVDPIGQGERQQLIDEKGIQKTRGVTTAHTLIQPAYMLTGTSLAAEEYFDNSRAIDYLLTRKDIDGSRIGCYGFSGGGTQAAYLIGLDNRIQAGCVGLFFSSRERTLENQGPSDGCQWIPGEGINEIGIADMAMMNAPKPFLILDGLYDFVDHWGALQGFEEIKQCYTALGYPERIDQYYSEDGHATPIDIQQKMVRFFRKWLLEKKDSLIDLTPWRGKGMNCTRSGQVNIEFKDSRSTMQACAEKMDVQSSDRENFCSMDIISIKRRIETLLGVSANTNRHIETIETDQNQLREGKEYRYQINCKGEYPLAVIVRIPDNVKANAPINIHITDSGMETFFTETDCSDDISDGSIIIAADLRGFGESSDSYQANPSKYWNSQYRTAVITLHAGRPLLGQRVTDIITLLNFIGKNEKLRGRTIHITADGMSGVAVMHATILDERISSASLSHTLKSWRSYIENPLQYDMMPNIIPGVLKYYDIPDLIRLSKGRIQIVD